MSRIFIAYRRQDSKFFQNAVYQKMADRFGARSVIRDVDNIPVGSDFRKYLQDEVARCHALLAVIGDRWLPILQGRVRQDIDFLQLEIEAALTRDIPVVPVLVGSAKMPPRASLPEPIAPLVYRQGIEVRMDTLDKDLKNLVKRLNQALDPKNKPVPGKKRPGAHDLALRISVRPKEAEIGIQFSWTVTVRNDGDDDLSGLKVKRGRTILADSIDLPTSRGRRFNFKTRYTTPGRKSNSVTVTGRDAEGKSLKVATRLAVRVTS